MVTKISFDEDIQKVNKDMKANGEKYGFAHYNIQEDVLQLLRGKYGSNRNYEEVNTKVKLLNLFYSTNLLATSQMSKHIVDIKDVDKKLNKGDKTLVKEMATLNGRENYSFATKYCALHQPEKFPIFDSIVATAFVDLFKQGYFAPRYTFARSSNPADGKYNINSFYNDVLRDYSKYVEFYDFFKETFGIKSSSYREIDFYIWGSCKIPKLESQIEKMLSKETRTKINAL